jgi:hypothetical protein
MNLTENSIVSFTPDAGYEACFQTETETWRRPVIGWAVVIEVCDPAEDPQHETGIQPVILDEEGDPLTVYWYKRFRAADSAELIRHQIVRVE